MKVETYPLGDIQANCYLIWNDNHVLMVDPGGSSRKIAEHIAAENGIVDAILLTHGHFDHIAGVEHFQKLYKCPVYVSEQEKRMLKDPNINGSHRFQNHVVVDVDTKSYQMHEHIGNFDFEVFEAPGHSEGSVLLIFDDFIISGDVLFQMSVGRTDLATGSSNKMNQTLAKIKMLEKNYIVYPGHGPSTTLDFEKQNNPYL
ncbi:glyoxylase-like metal-dependent hydrolase (beta-lactamase superfamily II) [Breznakia blatticola]|uniref:Glyoxylase-like metal-dependent hydrolase (Beta-lactamase superfamily II) n=1 Tax=Breznakia blatticola TaxID=1754012 RepID=A0A4R7ZXE3_9FIRM|nr:MBL fold metallo-hydrolase [Breznakia blatticola]TDW20360.1 glyoxylase-like metal-dependent hydrolase (beta-lactamase superfamily II) [Breznakia blatticola]